MNSLRVLNNNILVTVASETEELGNGLAIDARNNSRRKIIKGTVVISDSKEIMEGDIVYFPLYSGDEISLKGNNYYLIKLDDIKLIESK